MSAHQLPYVAPFNVLHRDEVHTFYFVEIEDRADVRVVK